MTDSILTDAPKPFLALVSKLLVGEKPCPVRFMYKTVPADLRDTGWRMYSGYETPEELADKKNMQPYPVETLIKMDPSLEELLKSKPGSVWERVPGEAWQEVEDFDIPEEEDVETRTVQSVDDFKPS
ncbi:DUF2185 domain-containing protein [Motiliproteus coralliicola]|uniref:DUF2185 domain-containing protein n=1 Tax=Motiliproteus coralliicola TaxID=2283196 RepID=A0A369WRN9_9GAMM|nr:DUF2185 domain-containing protein [Motiliproteus coralliicola]RDE24327.1 DUF2185 domain-containing protein [Motiliproteus coralliicola]